MANQCSYLLSAAYMNLNVNDAPAFGYEEDLSANLGFIQSIDVIASFLIKLPPEILLDPKTTDK
ncbi:hypothetical protein Echvi_1006 [Echinicola vietnamensis DSM 17526]|uniref:Uncharacterized protein n=2 Tax=Echinicola TaxID=390846 RepID=L0FVE3_ECHVK|nr:hypothetical protein Echvi_1006 [Echinicola vietnamensis DSM 17526]